MTIKHLVISGGGPTAIKSLGSLKYLHEHGIWNIKDIKSIYATSAGVIISVLLLLEFEFDIIVNYIIHRPWHEVYKIRLDDIVGAYTRKGILDEQCVDVFFMPFFKAKDIDINITLEERKRVIHPGNCRHHHHNNNNNHTGLELNLNRFQ